LSITTSTSVEFDVTCTQLRQVWGDYLDAAKVVAALNAVDQLPLGLAMYPAHITAIQQQPDVAADAFAMGMRSQSFCCTASYRDRYSSSALPLGAGLPAYEEVARSLTSRGAECASSTGCRVRLRGCSCGLDMACCNTDNGAMRRLAARAWACACPPGHWSHCKRCASTSRWVLRMSIANKPSTSSHSHPGRVFRWHVLVHDC
jgi:hypothetical protein